MRDFYDIIFNNSYSKTWAYFVQKAFFGGLVFEEPHYQREFCVSLFCI